MNAVKEDVIELADKELQSANEQFPLFQSQHEGYAVLLEEVEEAGNELVLCKISLEQAWRCIKNNTEDARSIIDKMKGYAINLATEAIQVAAMAQKFIDSMEKPQEESKWKICKYNGHECLKINNCDTCPIYGKGSKS